MTSPRERVYRSAPNYGNACCGALAITQQALHDMRNELTRLHPEWSRERREVRVQIELMKRGTA